MTLLNTVVRYLILRKWGINFIKIQGPPTSVKLLRIQWYMACQGISSKVKLNLLHLALLKAKQGMMSSGTPESLETTYFSFGYETPAHVPSNSIKLILELPWHPFVRILHFYCRRHGFHPGQRTKITHTARPKNKRTKSYYFLMWPIWYLIEMVSILVIASSRSYGHMAFEMSMFLAKFFCSRVLE